MPFAHLFGQAFLYSSVLSGLNAGAVEAVKGTFDAFVFKPLEKLGRA